MSIFWIFVLVTCTWRLWDGVTLLMQMRWLLPRIKRITRIFLLLSNWNRIDAKFILLDNMNAPTPKAHSLKINTMCLDECSFLFKNWQHIGMRPIKPLYRKKQQQQKSWVRFLFKLLIGPVLCYSNIKTRGPQALTVTCVS